MRWLVADLGNERVIPLIKLCSLSVTMKSNSLLIMSDDDLKQGDSGN